MANERSVTDYQSLRVELGRPNLSTAFCAMVVWALALFPVSPTAAQQLDLANGDFSEWRSGQPVDWDVAIGATNGGNSPISVIQQGADASLQLSGNIKTRAWQSVSQTIPVKGGKSYRVRFSAKVDGLKVEDAQLAHCSVGILQKHERGQVLQRTIKYQDSPEYLENSIVFRTHNFAASIEVVVLLSNTGTLNVKDVSVEQLRAADSFQILFDEMDRGYSYFEHKNVDWPALANKYRAKLVDCDSDTFTDVAATMLAEIKDTHIWLEHRRNRVSKYFPNVQENCDFEFVEKDLTDARSFGTFGITGLTSGGLGYVRISSLAVEPQTVEQLVNDVQERLFDTEGIILDLRKNPGGSELCAQSIAALFATEETVYARAKFRASGDHSDFYETDPRLIGPASKTYAKPTVCLIGPGAVSSAEALAMMMKAIPTATLIGQPTRGASGSPLPIQLPNGVDVWFSRWCLMLPDGTLIEDDGVLPDETVAHGEGDPAYTRAVEFLKNSEK